MFRNIFFFEIKYRIKRPATYIYFAIFLLFSFMSVVSNDITVGDVTSTTNRNAPLLIATLMSILSAFGIMVVSAIMSTPVYRDIDHNTHTFYFTMPMKKMEYLGGRFLGSFFIAILVFTGIPLGIFLGTVIGPAAGWISYDSLNAFNPIAYIQPFLIFVIPNILFTGAIFFALATLSRKIVYAYMGNVILLVIYVAALNLIMDIEHLEIGSLLDPFAIISIQEITRYWTPAEMNINLIPLTDTLLWNRIIWTGAGIIFVVITFAAFKFSSFLKVREKKIKTAKLQSNVNIAFPKVKTIYGPLVNAKNIIKLGFYVFKNIVKEVPFIVIVFSGLALILTGAISVGSMYGTDLLPVTYIMLRKFGGAFILFYIIILTFYGGELVWRERSQQSHLIFDSLPVPGGVYYLGKLLAMVFIIFLLNILLMLSGMLFQISQGYYNFEIGLYLKHLFLIDTPYFLFISVFILFVQSLVKNKFLGHFIVVIYYIITGVLPDIGLEHDLWRFFQTPSVIYSEMNGYGHFMERFTWYVLYWGGLAGVIAVLTYLYWKRGTETRLRNKLRIAKHRFNNPAKVTISVFLLLFLFSGGYILRETTILNEYKTSKEEEQAQVDYERKYKKYEHYPIPKIEDVKMNVDIFPYQRKLSAEGFFTIRNRSDKEIDSVFVILPGIQKDYSITFGKESKLVHEDEACDFYIYALSEPLAPGETTSMDFNILFHEKHFREGSMYSRFAYNGTFVNSHQICPRLGYQAGYEISDKKKREELGLPPRERMAEVNDTNALMSTYLGTDGDWISFEAVVSTSTDQVALAPGYLQKEWTEGNRKYFHYKMDSKILNFYAFISARYEVAKEKHHGVDLEIYYQEGHEYNLGKIFKSMRQSLDYFGENFSPYQHRQLRVIEFPRYSTFAQSFPNTIPYSEGIGFIADLEDEGDIDYVFYVTAHEIAHQWWAHQVIGGNVKGATVMSEALAQYSALMVMEKEYGKEKMRRFLKYELDRYLVGRRYEANKELPLYLNENQGYIHYRKGSVIMYALKDYIGEKNLNKALARYIDSTAFQEPPFTNSPEFLTFIDEATPDSLDYLIDDWFKTITLYSNKANTAEYTKIAENKFKVDISLESHKYRADSLGNEREIDFRDYIDIGITGKDDKPLYLKKHLVKGGQNTFSFIVEEKPVKAGIDIYNKLIDRDSDDNVIEVEKISS